MGFSEQVHNWTKNTFPKEHRMVRHLWRASWRISPTISIIAVVALTIPGIVVGFVVGKSIGTTQVNITNTIPIAPSQPPEIPNKGTEKPNQRSTALFPDLRLANNPSILKLFNDGHQHEIMALLMTGQITTWARSTIFAQDEPRPSLQPVGVYVWEKYRLTYFPKNIDGTVLQTYLASNQNNLYYDIYFSSDQIKSILDGKKTGIALDEIKFVFDTSEEPMLWKSPFISYSGTNVPDTYVADAFRMIGTNIGGREITIQKAQIISSITSQILNLKVELTDLGKTTQRDITEINALPPKADIELSAWFSKDGISEQKFLSDWGKFVFSVMYDGKERRYLFDEHVVHDLLNQWGNRQSNLSARPRITPRTTDDDKK
jgi:hypothetical protein